MKIPLDNRLTHTLDQIILASSERWKPLEQQSNHCSFEQFNSISCPLGQEVYYDGRDLYTSLLTEQQGARLASAFGFSRCTNYIAYPPNTIMAWHTNSDTPGVRTYYIYTERPGIFRYIDESGDTVDDYDNVGWTARSFKINPEKPLWHTVWSQGLRFAFGFNTAS